MSSVVDNLWAQIVEVHNEAKALFLLGEELDKEPGNERFLDYVQPINEHRHSLEHIVRAKANEVGLDGGVADEKYQSDCLHKALGHEYRAFFDCADWIGIILREDIDRMLRPYDVECIRTVLSDYYSHLRSRITEISTDIARMRGIKDISRNNKVLEDVSKYKHTIEELQDIHKKVMLAQDSLAEYRVRARRSGWYQWAKGILATLVVAAIVGIAGFFLGRFNCNVPVTPTDKQHQNQLIPHK